MKRIGFTVLAAAAAAIALAACLKVLPDLVVSRESGDYNAPFSLSITVTKPDDCSVLGVEIDAGGTKRRSTLLSAGVNQLPPLSINGPTTVTVTLKPSSACWFYQTRTFEYAYKTPTVIPDMSAPPDLVPPPDLTAPPDLMPPPPDLVPPPDLIDPCTNGAQDGNETDTDCGGATCSARCTAGDTCVMTSDCMSGLLCFNTTCINP
jgi:hypothetical protein